MHIRWRGLELPSVVDCDAKTLTSTYGKFTAEPFERGFGVTVGNSLRRILLSSLEGSAVTQIKVRGAQHEFTTIPGVSGRHDRYRAERQIAGGQEPQRCDARDHGREERAGPITGADVQTDADVEVINKDHVLATLDRQMSRS